jgi:sigma-B regulation protein RsbU (phosphoserine phosphatase)
MSDELIRCIPLFASLPDEEIALLATTVRPVHVNAGTMLFHEGQQEGRFFVLVEGKVEIIKAIGTEDERQLAVREPCCLLGELSLLSQDGTHTASVRALTHLQLLELQAKDLDDLLHRHPTFAYEMIRTLSHRLVEGEDHTIRDLRRKNRELTRLYVELKEAQVQLIEKEKLEKELQVARDIQMSILPRKLPEIEEYSFFAKIVPMRAVGGDFYDLIELGDKRMGIAIGDVSDHGVPAALFMALTATLVRAEADATTDPGLVLQNVNRHLMKLNDTGMFVTILYGILDFERASFDYARAGHEYPLLFSETRDDVPLPSGFGQPLGLFDDVSVDRSKVKLNPGNVLVLYTDGITDARDTRKERFGVKRLRESLRKMGPDDAQGIGNGLWSVIESYRGAEEQTDDITIFVLMRDG